MASSLSSSPPPLTVAGTYPSAEARAKEVKEFDDSKIGVKGLLDSGMTSIPRFFVHPPESLPTTPSPTVNPNSLKIPTIDLSQPRSSIVGQVHHACTTLGFFQIINHGIPSETLSDMINSIKRFNEQPADIKSKFYTREMGRVSFLTNSDLFKTKAASWRDTLQIALGSAPVDEDLLPEVCRSAVIEWDRCTLRLGETLMGIISQALGLSENRLKDLSFLEARLMTGHYYPHCPQSHLTYGTTPHMDPSVLTILLQDQIGGLEIKHGEDWVKVDPVEGALIVNIGDLLEVISNGEYKSVEHRVLANSDKQARISVAVFFFPIGREGNYGPLHEFVSQNKPAVYQHFTYGDFMQKLFLKVDGEILLDSFKV